jgi:hypothetical protein
MAKRELKAGDKLRALMNVTRGNLKKGDIVTVEKPLLRWPSQNFYAVERPGVEFAHQPFEHVGFQIGDKVQCVSGRYASYSVGDVGRIVEVLSDDRIRLNGSAPQGWHHVKDFKLVVDSVNAMSEEEWEYNEGWINQATYHAAMCFFNDSKAMEELDRRLKRRTGLMSPYNVSKFCNLPEGLKRSDIDSWSLQHHRAVELQEDGRITQDTLDFLERVTFQSKHSGTCNRRLELLRKAGFKTSDHFFTDYKKGLPAKVKTLNGVIMINPFEKGDKVELVHDYMEVPDCGTEPNAYAMDNKMELDTIYEVVTEGAESLKVKGKSYWMNPRQFKLATSPATRMSKEDTMKKLKIETITYINDTNVTDYDALAQAQMVEKYEAEIARLEAFTTKPKKVVALIAEMKADLAAAVAAFDAVED